MDTTQVINKTEWLALKALNDGVASDRQQKIAILAILHKLAVFNQTSFEPENQYKTAFNEGRRFVGTLLMEAIRFNWDLVEQQRNTTKPKPSLTTKK